ncbi:Aminopeptidase N-like 3, partial [Homarus americanus]
VTNTTTTTTTTTDISSTPPPTTTTETPKLNNYRLPESLKPLHYLVKLQPFVNGNYTILGYLEVEMKVVNSTSRIVLHMADIITHNDTITVVQDGVQVVVKEHVYDAEREWYVAQLDQELQVDQTVNISLWFTGLLNDQLRGFYRSSYVDPDGNTVEMAATQFQPTDARRAFPCMDEPALKAKFSVSLAREENMTSLSNMPRYGSEPVEDQPEWEWDHYDTTVEMSTYLIAFIVSDFVNKTVDVNGTQFSVWARPAAIDQTDYSLALGPRVLTFFEDYFNISYPLPKQDMAAIPDFSAAAMENWGLIIYSKQWIGETVTHELAHQWFGNLVTPRWWTDLWLNEGFATYLAFVGLSHVEESWKMMEQVVGDVHYVFGVDSLETSHPISIPVGHPHEINEIFDAISYYKGASIIRMMEHFLTEETFKMGLISYLNHFAYNSATQDDLWQFLTAAAHQDGTLTSDLTVKVIMDTWTLQMGYPLITVIRSNDGTSATVTQSDDGPQPLSLSTCVLLIPRENMTARQQEAPYRWWVPLSYTSANNSDFSNTIPSEWMKDSEEHKALTSLPASDQWVIFNLQETGYYRVNYDSNNWALITDQLKADHEAIHVINRAQIIDDALNLARAGRLPYEVVLRIIEYLKREKEFVPIKAALNGLSYLQMMMKTTTGYGALKKYLLALVTPLYEAVGFEDNLMDPQLQQYKRVLALSTACKLGLQDCVDNAVSQFQAWINGSDISPNLKSTVFCYGVASGGEEEWNATWSKYLSSNVATEKEQLLKALGCSKHTWILKQYLEMAFTENKGIKKQDIGTVFRAVAVNEIGRSLARNYLMRNWLHISQYVGSITLLEDLINDVLSQCNTGEEKDELERLYAIFQGSLGSATRFIQQILETITNNVAWMDRNYSTIVAWLNTNGYSAGFTR